MPPSIPAAQLDEADNPGSDAPRRARRKPHRRSRGTISTPPSSSDDVDFQEEMAFEEALEEAFQSDAPPAETVVARANGPARRPKKAAAKAKKPAAKKKPAPKSNAKKAGSKKAPAKKATAKKAAAKKVTRKKRAATNKGSSRLLSELWGIMGVAGAVLVACALISYSPIDPAIHASGSEQVGNWIGPGGAIVADFLASLLGLGSYGVPFVLLVLGLRCFSLRPTSLSWVRGAGTFVALLSAATLLQVLLQGNVELAFPPGGLVGVLVAGLGEAAISRLGTGIVAFSGLVVGANLLSSKPLMEVAAELNELFWAQVEKAQERYLAWKEHRRLMAEEHEALWMELEEKRQEEDENKGDKKEERAQRVKEKAREMALSRIEDNNATIVEEKAMVPTNVPRIAGRADDKSEDLDDDELLFSNKPMPISDPAWVARLTQTRTVKPGATESKAPDAVVIPLERERQTMDVRIRDLNAPPAKKEAPKAAPPIPVDVADNGNDDALKIVERDVDGAAKLVEEAEKQKAPNPYGGDFKLPPIKLLDYDAPDVEPIDEQKIHRQAEKLVQKFRDFNIDGKVREIRPGPVVTTFEFVPAAGVKVSKIAALADDIAMAMEAIHVRIVAPIPGKGAVGIELPNPRREMVFLKEIVADPIYRDEKHPLCMAMGKDIEGKPYFSNLAKMPHVLISGTTGSGKSVSVNAMICSILFRASPDDVRFLMIDPKMLELNIYDGIPHLLLPPITDSKKAALALRWAVEEMERRYQCMSELGVRDIAGYNVKVKETVEAGEKLPEGPGGKPHEKMPFIVVVVDEYADLIAVAGKDVEGYIMRLAQKARACGIHVMLATQRPSVDVITGVIKSNFPVRMGFRLASSHDSKTIVNSPGAEKLLGHGDMLIMPPGTSDLTRVQGAYISEKELHRVVDFLKSQGKPNYDMNIVAPPEDESGEAGDGADENLDARYHEALQVVARTKKCSTSWLQRQLGVGYNRAARIVEALERNGAVGPILNSKGDREIYVQPNAVEGDGRVF